MSSTSNASNASNLTPIDLSVHQKSQGQNTSFLTRLSLRDAVFAVLMVALFAYGGMKSLAIMDVYEKAILVMTVLAMVALGWSFGGLCNGCSAGSR